MISILHPSRSRPELASKAASMWIANAGCDVEYFLSLDRDDPLHYQYAHLFSHHGTNVITGRNRSAIDAINYAAMHTTGDVIVVMSDDFLCFPGWGKKIQQFMSHKADWILKTQDGVQEWIITLPIMDRIYYERFGYIYHPDYAHAFCDTELTCVAELTACKFVSDMMFNHLNAPGTKIVDSVSEKNDATFEQGRKLFVERKKRNFDLKELSGVMSVNIYTQMQ